MLLSQIKRSILNLFQITPGHTLTMSVLVGSYTILTLALLLHQNIQTYLSQWGQNIRVNVYLLDEAKTEEIKKVENFLRDSNQFATIDFLTKQQAAEKFKKKVGSFAPGLLSDLEFDNPLPASFEMTVNGSVESSERYNEMLNLIKDVKLLPGIEDISYGQGWVENYASVLKVFSTTSLFFIFVLLSGSLFVIGNSVRNSLTQRSDEIEILELFGATKSAIMRPFIIEGLLMGAVASLMAILLSYIFFTWQFDVLANDLSFWSKANQFSFLSFSRVLLAFLAGTALGGLGSYLWIKKAATGWSAAEALQK